MKIRVAPATSGFISGLAVAALLFLLWGDWDALAGITGGLVYGLATYAIRDAHDRDG